MGTIIKTLIAVTMQHLKPMNEQKFVEETKLCHKINKLRLYHICMIQQEHNYLRKGERKCS